jgi:hypothetical protein
VLSYKQVYAAGAARGVCGIEHGAFYELGNTKPETLWYRNTYDPRACATLLDAPTGDSNNSLDDCSPTLRGKPQVGR